MDNLRTGTLGESRVPKSGTSDRFSLVREDLIRIYGKSFSEGSIDRVLEEVISESERAAIDRYTPVFVQREAAERLELMSRDPRRDIRPDVVFVDQRNTGRAPLAAALLRNLCGDDVWIRAVGLDASATDECGDANTCSGRTEAVDAAVAQVLAERGCSADDLGCGNCTPRTVHRSTVIVQLGVEDIPSVPGNRYEYWDIDDMRSADLDHVRAVADELTARIKDLLAGLHKSV